MRIGTEFQADVASLSSTSDPSPLSQGSGSVLVWTPNPGLKAEDCKNQLVKNAYVYICTQRVPVVKC